MLNRVSIFDKMTFKYRHTVTSQVIFEVVYRHNPSKYWKYKGTNHQVKEVVVPFITFCQRAENSSLFYLGPTQKYLPLFFNLLDFGWNRGCRELGKLSGNIRRHIERSYLQGYRWYHAEESNTLDILDYGYALSNDGNGCLIRNVQIICTG